MEYLADSIDMKPIEKKNQTQYTKQIDKLSIKSVIHSMY